ncbi:MAG: LysM peptidoglycan-binding domain-containing protein, partial [Bacteroidota bacterium]
MKFRKIIILSLLLLISSAATIFAQDIEKSKKTELINNKTYFIHTVRTSQTLYAIAKAYTVDLSEIRLANPEIKTDIQPGVILKIPQVKNPELVANLNHVVEKGETLYKIANNYGLKVPDVVAANAGLTENLKPGQNILIPLPVVKKPVEPVPTSLHIVQKGETLFSIATQYATTVAELINLNTGLTSNLQLGQQLKVPVVKNTEPKPKKDSVVVFECGKTGKQDSYNIAVMIPFYLDISYNIDTGDVKTPASSYKSLTFIQFYEGVKMALDSLERNGFSAKVYIYDVAEDTSSIASILRKP